MKTKNKQGGKREGAGRPKSLDPKVTFPHRVKKSYIEAIKNFIKKLDEQEKITIFDSGQDS